MIGGKVTLTSTNKTKLFDKAPQTFYHAPKIVAAGTGKIRHKKDMTLSAKMLKTLTSNFGEIVWHC
jgi:hypothetical protein